MELKLGGIIGNKSQNSGINRTFMELKLSSASSDVFLTTVLIEPLWN